MNILTTIPDSSLAAWEIRLAEFNAGSNQPPVDLAGYWQILVTEETKRHVTAKADTDKTAMAANERLMVLGAAVMAQPDKLDAVEAAVKPILGL